VSYSVSYSRAAAKAFRRIHPREQRRIMEAIEALVDDPRPDGSVQLAGGEGELRIRIGDYRVVYDIRDEQLIILVLRIGHRREVYR